MTRGGAQKGKFVHSKKSTTSVFALSTSSPYIYEHNRGGAWSLSTSSPTFMNTTEEVLQVSHVQTQKLKTSPSTINAEHLLLWFGFIFTTEVLEFFYWIGLPFWAPPLVNYVHKIRGAQQKISNRGGWDFLLNTSFVFINVRGGGAQCKILSTSSVFWKCEYGPKGRAIDAIIEHIVVGGR